MLATIQAFLQDSDPFAWSQILVFFLAGVFFFEKIILLNAKHRMHFKKFLDETRRKIDAKEIDQAMRSAKNNKNKSFGLLTARVLEVFESEPLKAPDRADEEVFHIYKSIEARLSYLPIFAVLAMMVGILGSVVHLWSSLHSLDVLNHIEKQTLLGASIADSLVYLAMAMAVSSFSLVAFYLNKAFASRLYDEVTWAKDVLKTILKIDAPLMPAYAAPAVAPPLAAEPVVETNASPAPDADVEAASGSGDDVEAMASGEAASEEQADASMEAFEDDIHDEEEII